MNAINPNHDDTFEVQQGSPVIGAKPANNGTSAQPNSNFIMYYSIAEIIEESKKRQLIADAQEAKFREFLETIAKARGFAHSGFIKTGDIAADKVIDSAAKLFSLTKATPGADGSALLTTNDGHAIKIKNNQITYAGAADPKAPKQFDKNAAMVMALAALEDPSMMPPNVIHIDNATKAQKRLIQEAFAQINQERGLNLKVENPSRSLMEKLGFGTKTRAEDPAAQTVEKPESALTEEEIAAAKKELREKNLEERRTIYEQKLNLAADSLQFKPTTRKAKQGAAILQTQMPEDPNTYYVIELQNPKGGKYTLVQINNANGKMIARHPDDNLLDTEELKAKAAQPDAPKASPYIIMPADKKTFGETPLDVWAVHTSETLKTGKPVSFGVMVDGKYENILSALPDGKTFRHDTYFLDNDTYHDLHPKNPIKAAQKIEAAINTPEGKKNIKENGTVVGKTNGRSHANVYSVLHDGQKIEVAKKGGAYRILTIDGKQAELNQDIKINKTASVFASAAADKPAAPLLLENPVVPGQWHFKTSRDKDIVKDPLSPEFLHVASTKSRLNLSTTPVELEDPNPSRGEALKNRIKAAVAASIASKPSPVV